MNNEIAKSLNWIGNMYLWLSIIVGVLVMFLKLETYKGYYSSYSEWNPVVLVYSGAIIITGIIINLIFRGFADIIENTSESKLYQKEILNLLKQQYETNGE